MAEMVWSNCLINRGIVFLTAILVVVFIGRLTHILPLLGDGVFRWKAFARIEDNIRLTADRNTSALISVLVLCIAISRYGILEPVFFKFIPFALRLPATLGLAAGFFLLRAALSKILYSKRVSLSLYSLGLRCIWNYSILCAGAVAVAIILGGTCGLNALSIRTVLLYIMGVFGGLFLLRRTEILAETCGFLRAILYLCTLELIPMGLVAVTTLPLWETMSY